jgi:hypothetical protein
MVAEKTNVCILLVVDASLSRVAVAICPSIDLLYVEFDHSSFFELGPHFNPCGQSNNSIKFSKVPIFDHTICLVQYEELYVFDLCSQIVILEKPDQLKGLVEKNLFSHTTLNISHSRPGVATRISAPRFKIRDCFWDDIPPTTVATLTIGGAWALT